MLSYQVEKGAPFIKHEAAFIYLIIERVLLHRRGLQTLEECREQFQELLGTIKGSRKWEAEDSQSGGEFSTDTC